MTSDLNSYGYLQFIPSGSIMFHFSDVLDLPLIILNLLRGKQKFTMDECAQRRLGRDLGLLVL